MSYRLGCVMEQTIGHVTHHQNLANWLTGQAKEASAAWIPVHWEVDDPWDRLPVVRDTWSLRGSIRARAGLRRQLRQRHFDALLFHTQAISLFSVGIMRRIPSVLSMDATPVNLDTIVHTFGDAPCNDGVAGWVKERLYRRAFHAAAAIAPWSHWVRDSLIRDYGVDGSKIEVIPAGVDLQAWQPVPRRPLANRRLRLLFVGGDFQRKGGHILLQAFAEKLAHDCEIDVVTGFISDVRPQDHLRVHRGLQANSDALKRLFADADLLVLPTLGDCMPLVLTEAMASGLPVIATRVGAIDEQVEHGKTGLLVPPNDLAALVQAIESTRNDDARRLSMGAAGRAAAEAKFCDKTNFRRLLALMERCADERASSLAARNADHDAEPTLSNKMS